MSQKKAIDIETMEKLDTEMYTLLNKSTNNCNYVTMIGIIDVDSYIFITGKKDCNWKYKYINIALDLNNKKVVDVEKVTKEKLYNIKNVFNNKLVIKLSITNNKLNYESLYYISEFIKKSVKNGLINS